MKRERVDVSGVKTHLNWASQAAGRFGQEGEANRLHRMGISGGSDD
jgi:hypothetical protein